MKRYIPILILILFVGCKSHKTQVRTVEKRTTTLVPYALPADSSYIEAYFECDSLNNVILRELDEAKTRKVSTQYKYSDGLLKYYTIFLHDTIYLPTDTIYIERNEVIAKKCNNTLLYICAGITLALSLVIILSYRR